MPYINPFDTIDTINAYGGDEVEPGDEWEYDRWSITNVDAWDWNRVKIQEYFRMACLNPSKTRIRHQWLADDLRLTYNQIIVPAMARRAPYILIKDTSDLRIIEVHSRHGIPIPITDFYSAIAWVITITESPSVRPVDYKRLLCYMVRWSATLSHQGMKSLLAIPNTACVYWMDIPSGKWQELYDGYTVIFSVSFNLPDRRIVRDKQSAAVKEKARLQRWDHLVDNVGSLPPEPRAVQKGRIVKWGHCAETLTLTSALLADYNPKGVFHTLAMNTQKAIEMIAEDPGPYRSEIMTINAFKEMCGNCNTLMEQVGVLHGWADPKNGFVDHYLEMKAANNILKKRKKEEDKAKKLSKKQSRKASVKAKGSVT